MKLLSIENAKGTAVPGALELQITFDPENGDPAQSVPFGYVPGDPYGLGPEVESWLNSHPDMPIGDYVPPAEPPGPTVEELLSDIQSKIDQLKALGVQI